MNRNFIFVFILLAALSLVNAMPHELRKRTTTFGPCSNLDKPVLDITISPDPIVAGASVTFTVSGTLKQDILCLFQRVFQQSFSTILISH